MDNYPTPSVLPNDTITVPAFMAAHAYRELARDRLLRGLKAPQTDNSGVLDLKNNGSQLKVSLGPGWTPTLVTIGGQQMMVVAQPNGVINSPTNIGVLSPYAINNTEIRVTPGYVDPTGGAVGGGAVMPTIGGYYLDDPSCPPISIGGDGNLILEVDIGYDADNYPYVNTAEITFGGTLYPSTDLTGYFLLAYMYFSGGAIDLTTSITTRINNGTNLGFIPPQQMLGGTTGSGEPWIWFSGAGSTITPFPSNY